MPHRFSARPTRLLCPVRFSRSASIARGLPRAARATGGLVSTGTGAAMDGRADFHAAAAAAAAVVSLNPADCNLDLDIGGDGLSCSTLSQGGFAYCWSGGRATLGIQIPPLAAPSPVPAQRFKPKLQEAEGDEREKGGKAKGDATMGVTGGANGASGGASVAMKEEQGKGVKQGDGEGALPSDSDTAAAAGDSGAAAAGAADGKYCFACVVEAEKEVAMADTPAADRHLCRVGVSVSDSDVGALGEVPLSFGYGGTGKKSCGNRFMSYGERFGVGDTVACLLDVRGGTIAFAKNGTPLGTAFTLLPEQRQRRRVRASTRHQGEKCAVKEQAGSMEAGNKEAGKEEAGKEAVKEEAGNEEAVKEAGKEEAVKAGVKEDEAGSKSKEVEEVVKKAEREQKGAGDGAKAQGTKGGEAGSELKAEEGELLSLFPHVLLKNVSVRLQFSLADGLQPPDGYAPWADAVHDGCAVAGPQPPPEFHGTRSASPARTGGSAGEARDTGEEKGGAQQQEGQQQQQELVQQQQQELVQEQQQKQVQLQLPRQDQEQGQGQREVLMMVGLPGSGKTTWAERLRGSCPDKRYVVLGTDLVLDQMKVPGLTRRRSYGQRWAHLMPLATEVFNKLLERAATVPRNYIIDQTNVYQSARIRKMKAFPGFRKVAVVMVPPEAELQRRSRRRTQETGKDVPDDAVNEMKANFVLPRTHYEAGSRELFDEVRYVELQQPEAERVVERQRIQARAALGQAATMRRAAGMLSSAPTSSPRFGSAPVSPYVSPARMFASRGSAGAPVPGSPPTFFSGGSAPPSPYAHSPRPGRLSFDNPSAVLAAPGNANPFLAYRSPTPFASPAANVAATARAASPGAGRPPMACFGQGGPVLPLAPTSLASTPTRLPQGRAHEAWSSSPSVLGKRAWESGDFSPIASQRQGSPLRGPVLFSVRPAPSLGPPAGHTSQQQYVPVGGMLGPPSPFVGGSPGAGVPPNYRAPPPDFRHQQQQHQQHPFPISGAWPARPPFPSNGHQGR